MRDVDVTELVDSESARRMDRSTHLAIAARRQAEADSGIDIALAEPHHDHADLST